MFYFVFGYDRFCLYVSTFLLILEFGGINIMRSVTRTNTWTTTRTQFY